MVKEGYKQTNIGVIPKDWEVKKLGEFGNFSKGKGVRKDDALSGEFPCVRYGEIYTYHDDYIKTFNSFISSDIANNAKRLKNGDILFAGSGETKEEIGKCVAFINAIEAYAGGDIVILSPKNVNSLFLGYILNVPMVAKQKSSKGQGDAVVHISATSLGNVQIPIPPIKEQKAIATVLSDTDELINSLEKLISKKEAIKTATMQQLLTGRKRLDGFSGEWEEKRLGDIVIHGGLVRGPFGGSLKKEHFVKHGYKVYEQKNAINANIEIGQYFINQDKYNELKRFEVQEDDFIVSCSGTIGRIYQIPKNSPKGIINQALLIIRVDTNKINSDFFLIIFKWEKFQAEIIDSTQGGAMKNLVGMDIFKNTPIQVPSFKEQKAIATILSDMDKELESLKATLSKTKAIKEGMMQELLTGKIRLIGQEV